MQKIGFIGLGAMGRPMAKNLLKAGYELFFVSRRPEVAQEFTAAGARQLKTHAEVTEQADVVISIVTADDQVREIALGPHGIVQAATSGKAWLEMSTIGPWTAREMATVVAAKGMQMLDAPVSGGPWGAAAGTLSIMAGGEAHVFEQCRPVLEVLGDKLFHVGPLGAGQTVKLVNQMVAGAIMSLIGEGFVLAKAAGADLSMLADVMAVSSGNSTVLEARGKKFLIEGNFTPGFTTELMRKDLGLALELGQQFQVPLPLAAAAYQQYQAAMRLGFAAEDFAAVAKVSEQAANLKISAPQ